MGCCGINEIVCGKHANSAWHTAGARNQETIPRLCGACAPAVCICLCTCPCVPVCMFMRVLAWPSCLLWPSLSSVGGRVSLRHRLKKAEAWEGLGQASCHRSRCACLEP